MWFLWFLAFRKYKIQYNWHCSYGFWPPKAIRIILIYLVLMASGMPAIRCYKNHHNLGRSYGVWPAKAIRCYKNHYKSL